MAFVLTRPANQSNVEDVTEITATVPAGNTIAIDGLSTTDMKSMKWIVTIEDITESRIRSFEVLGVNKFGIDADHNVYGKVGDRKIKYKVGVAITAGIMNLNITNNETHSLSVCATRVKVSR